MSRLILVDGNNWGFAGMANPRLSVGDKDTQAVFSVIKKTKNLFENHPNDLIVVLWDGRSWRKDFFKEYKANREATAKLVEAKNAYIEQKKDIINALSLLGVTQASADNMEADDLAYILTQKGLEKFSGVTLLTADKDWQQLVQPRVSWVDVIHGKTCRHETFEADTGFKNTEQFVEAKCVLGDRGDNVPGVMGIGPKALEGIYALHSNMDSFMVCMRSSYDRQEQMRYWKESFGKIMPKALREIDLDALTATMLKNRTLMDLATANRPSPINFKKTAKPLDIEAFELFCYKNHFKSIIATLDEFEAVFRNNKYVN